MTIARKLTAQQRDLADRHYGMAVSLASRFAEKYPPLRDDFRGAASLGLCRAAADYDESREVKFSTFAIHHIRGACLDLVRDDETTSPLGRMHHRKVGSDGPKVYSFNRVARRDEDEERGVLYVEFIPADHDRPVGWEAELRDEFESLVGILRNEFSDRTTAIFRAMYGPVRRTINEVGREFGVTGARVGGVRTECLRHIRAKLGLYIPGPSTAIEEDDDEPEVAVMTSDELVAWKPIADRLRATCEVHRLAILDRLRDGPLSRDRLQEATGQGEEGLRRNLRMLKAAGLVRSVSDGRKKRFDLTEAGRVLHDLIAPLRQVDP